MAQRHDGQHRHDDPLHGRAAERERLFSDERARSRGYDEDAYTDDHPGREWEHERSSGFRRGGEAYGRSPRIHEPERYGYGSGLRLQDERARRDREWFGGQRFGLGRERYDEYGDERPNVRRSDYDDRHDWQDSPGPFGERSYGGYGEWPGPEYEGIRIGREGYGGAGYDRLDWPERQRRSAGAEWGLGRAGARGGWRDDLRRSRGVDGARAGRYAGRGPKGYQRSDDRIHEDVCDLLLSDSYIDASNITVHVENGEVTLDGMIEDRGMKRAAEDRVEEIFGVKQVHNRLRVQPDDSSA